MFQFNLQSRIGKKATNLQTGNPPNDAEFGLSQLLNAILHGFVEILIEFQKSFFGRISWKVIPNLVIRISSLT